MISAKKSLLLFVFIFLLSVVGLYAYNNPGGTPRSIPESTPIVQQAHQTYKLDLIALTKFTSPLVEFIPDKTKAFLDKSLAGLSSSELDSLKQLVGVDKLELFSGKGYSADSVVISPFVLGDFRTKQLKFNGKNIYRDVDYGLRINISAESAAKLQQSLKLTSASELAVDLSKVNRIFMGGEIIPARAVDRLFLNVYNNYTLLFDRFRSEIESADLAMAMLENPISGDPKPCTGCTTFVGDEQNAKGFAEVGLDILGFGNHSGDGGKIAVENTEKALTAAGISYTGLSSQNLETSAKLVTKKFAGKTLGFLSADDIAWFYWATDTKWGANRFSKNINGKITVDQERINKVVVEAKKNVDYLIVMFSAGVEYTDTANSHQVELAHSLIDAGADFIVASHPHWVQNFEVYKDKPIFYSLGNLIFDQTHTDPTREGIVVNAYYYKSELVNLEVIPHFTCGYHQTKTNLAAKVISGEMSYAQVDQTPEKQGCVYWQPNPQSLGSQRFTETWNRFIKSTNL